LNLNANIQHQDHDVIYNRRSINAINSPF